MIKRTTYFLLFLFSLLLTFSVGMAQTPAAGIETLQISFWPDFDQPSVLVLLTGELSADVALPAEVSIPIPSDAEINAVALVDEQGMVSVDFDAASDGITFVATTPRFRVEYYAPYEQDGRMRAYDFEWQSMLPVAELAAEIQQPANATSLNSDPEAQDIYTNQVDNLVYHSLESLAIPAGTPYNVSFEYEMAADGLTIESAVASAGTADVAQPVEEEGNNWLLLASILGVVVLAMVGTWIVATQSSRRKSSRPRKPSPKRSSTTQKTTFCHVCGQQAESEDRFCRRCGAELKA